MQTFTGANTSRGRLVSPTSSSRARSRTPPRSRSPFREVGRGDKDAAGVVKQVACAAVFTLGLVSRFRQAEQLVAAARALCQYGATCCICCHAAVLGHLRIFRSSFTTFYANVTAETSTLLATREGSNIPNSTSPAVCHCIGLHTYRATAHQNYHSWSLLHTLWSSTASAVILQQVPCSVRE